jgi:hypothetical protein
MKFSFNYYKFICCHATHDYVAKLIQKIKMTGWAKNAWSKKRMCKFSIKLINALFYQNATTYHPPYNMMIFFSPKNMPSHTIGIIDGERTWEYWLGGADKNLKTMTFRFTTDIHDEGAIRELTLVHGQRLIRAIRVMKDPKWTLWLNGISQPFEEGKSYEKVKGKLIRDYFTMEDMIHFATNWGCPFDRDDFWDSDKPMYCFGNLENDESLADWTEYPDGFPV